MYLGTGTLAAIVLVLAGCATQPRPGSLQALDLQARKETRVECLKSQFNEMRYVPLTMLSDICDRVVLQRHGRSRH